MLIPALLATALRRPPPPLGRLLPERDAALEALVLRRDDRLLDDAGLSRCQAMGLGRYLWWELGHARP